ncbi:T9SS type A sorting domain-containing protein [Flavivirga sp. 57AJ16]|uniref:T9SS type A sorting domain-containing protein n=1 Tax=Flavivirga sp. 57AJ16 TaxID=3025307 RepID=UPI0023650E17|nr:T9SS type A sorting domain-containing protein [Flavivirga sp. 57AJ16]MDD7887974.1 T9SS type A sorting domain-containing protein [Flavivirga sp. 57AJ16]
MRKIGLIIFSIISLSGYAQFQIGEGIDGEATFELAGKAISLSEDGSIVAIGAYLNDENGDRSGQVRVYQDINSVWTQVGTDINGEASDDQSGMALSLSGDGRILAIGAPGNDGDHVDLKDDVLCSNDIGDSGHVRIYENIGGNWTQIGDDIDGEAIGDRSGVAVSLSNNGTIVAIGATSNSDNGEGAGHVRIYKNVADNWIQIGSDIDGQAAQDMSGYAVSLSKDGDVVAIGAIGNDSNGRDSGHVRIYENINGNWTQLGYNIDGDAAGDRSGFSVSLSGDGNIVAIGAIGNDSNGPDTGQVRVYENINNVWTKIGSGIQGETAGDKLGTSVSLSGAGDIVAVGAVRNNKKGYICIYQKIAGDWFKLHNNTILGEQANDGFGDAVSLSHDGNIAAVGAMYNTSNGIDAGHVSVYSLSDLIANPPNIEDGENGCDYSVLNEEGFESGWGIWNDGGSDSQRNSNKNYAARGSYSMRLRDNTSSSVGTTNNLDLMNYKEVTIEFSYYCRSMDNSNEDFWLQVSTDGGDNFTTVEKWNKGDDFENNQHYDDRVVISGPFSSETKFRFRADASNNSDYVYIDDIVIYACNIERCVLAAEDFESGWGIWNDGGSDSYRDSNKTYARTGRYSMRLRDNTSTSVGTTDEMNLSDYQEVTLDFSYYCRSMDNSNEDFWLQVSTNGGDSFTTVEKWNKGDDFENDEHYDDSVVISGPFSSETKFRFRADASNNGDYVYIDNIIISTANCINSNVLISKKSNDKNDLNNKTTHTIPEIITTVLYPNPFHKNINIKVKGSYETAEIEILNILGQSCFKKRFNNQETIEIPTLNLKNGQYIIRMKVDNQTIYKKGIKK